MEEIKLSIEEQIEVNLWRGVCVCVHNVIFNKGFKSLKYGEEKLVINGFNYDNAKLLAVKYGFEIPTGYDDGYWWTDRTSIDTWVKPRVAFIDALISELHLLTL